MLFGYEPYFNDARMAIERLMARIQPIGLAVPDGAQLPVEEWHRRHGQIQILLAEALGKVTTASALYRTVGT